MRSLWTISIAFQFLLIPQLAEAKVRAPKGLNERSLLYWRYLCENQLQQEKIKNDSGSEIQIDLSCPEQEWTVRSLNGTVFEVVENAK